MTLGIIYIALLLASLIVMIKPGAAIFYKKIQIDTNDLIPEGDAYLYLFLIKNPFYNPTTALIVEDGKVLLKDQFKLVLDGKPGSFALESITNDRLSILFVPTSPGDPVEGEHEYQLYLRPHIISREIGQIGFILLALGLTTFLVSILTNQQKRKTLFASPFGLVTLWVEMFTQPEDAAAGKIPIIAPLSYVQHSVLNTILAAYLLMFMEWIFTITKPSFMDIISFWEKLKVLMISGLAVSVMALGALLLIFLVDILLSSVIPIFRKYALQLPSAFLLACLGMLMIDNFTYTIFKYGIATSENIVRFLYGLGFLAAIAYLVVKLSSSTAKSKPPRFFSSTSIIASLVMIISIILTGVSFKGERFAAAQNIDDPGVSQLPNILLLSSDGLSASNMSVYGYKRDTTPFLRELAKTSLLSLNHFTNSAHSMGSVTSLLTGKLPITTHVLYPPDRLQGSNMYQHLPGIFRMLGYRTISLGVPHYVDVNTINFQHAFDLVNCEENPITSRASTLSEYGYDNEVFFLSLLEERITDRIYHIFFVKKMDNPYELVTETSTYRLTDDERLECLQSEIHAAATTGQPLFAHLHLMATHGAKFSPTNPMFSKDKTQDADWMTDFYDDAILEFDQTIEQIVQKLQQLGLYDHTIIVIFTDHAQKYVGIEKIPLLIHFPEDQYAGTISTNTQNIDVPPTILDYLDIDIPAWMEGESLLSDLEPNRLIINPSVIAATIGSDGQWVIPDEKVKPPFYQFGKLNVIQCQNWFTLNLKTLEITRGVVEGYVNPCPEDQLDSEQVIREKVGRMWIDHGYVLPEDW